MITGHESSEWDRGLRLTCDGLRLTCVVLLCSSSRLALYVYEYLLHVGAQKSAQTFLSEVSHFP